MSSDPKTVSPTLSSPQERLLETRATGTISIRITHNALERCFKPAATPRSGAKHTWQNKVSLFKLSVALVDLGCPSLLGIHHTCVHPAICLPAALGQIDLYNCLTLPAFFLRETKSLAGLWTPSKNPKCYLCCNGILQERLRAVQVMQCMFCSSQPLSGPPTETLLSLLFLREAQDSTAGFNQKCLAYLIRPHGQKWSSSQELTGGPLYKRTRFLQWACHGLFLTNTLTSAATVFALHFMGYQESKGDVLKKQDYPLHRTNRDTRI